MIVQWVIVAIFVLVGLWVLKLEHHTRKIKIAVIVLIALIIYFSMVGIFTSEKVDITTPRGIVNAVYIYFGWVGQTVTNLWDIGVDTAHLVGNAIKIEEPKENREERR